MPHVPVLGSSVSLPRVGTESPNGQQKKGFGANFSWLRQSYSEPVSWSCVHCSVLNCQGCRDRAALMAMTVQDVPISVGLRVLDQLLRAFPH